MKKTISIAGAGHWLISSDRIGPKVLELIQGRYGTEIEYCHLGNTSLALLDHLHNQELMIVIDAGFQGKLPGEITVITPNLNHLTIEVTSVHQIGPLETLAIAYRLFPEKMPQRVLLITLETENIDEKTEKIACQQIIKILDQEIQRYENYHVN